MEYEIIENKVNYVAEGMWYHVTILIRTSALILTGREQDVRGVVLKSSGIELLLQFHIQMFL